MAGALSILASLGCLFVSFKQQNGITFQIVALVLGAIGVSLLLRHPQIRNTNELENLIAALRNKVDLENSERIAVKCCPRCAETIKAKAKICRYCQYEYEEQK